MINKSEKAGRTKPTNSLSMNFSKQLQIEQINEVLLEIAGGNYHQQAPISDDFNEIDAIASGINMLSEELRDTVISRNYLDSVLRSIVDMLFIFDEDFTILQITPKVCELLKQPERHFIGKSINTLFDGRKKKFLQRMKDQLLLEGKLHNIETSFKIPNKEKLPVTVSLFTLKDNRHVTTGYLMVAEDIKEKLVTSSALKTRNEELKTLIYRTSHDLKGPLASMLGLFSILEKEKQDLPTLQFYLGHLKKSAEKLNRTLSELLEIGIVDQSEPSAKKFNLGTSIHEVVNSLENYPGREQVEIKINAEKNLQISSSEKLLRSVLQNLIENSIKYRKPNKREPSVIRVSARTLKEKVLISVKDNGQGMDKMVLKRAFDMFYRGNEDSKGSGLGLFIVKTNIEKLKGEIKISSKRFEGTETRIILPLVF